MDAKSTLLSNCLNIINRHPFALPETFVETQPGVHCYNLIKFSGHRTSEAPEEWVLYPNKKVEVSRYLILLI
jgi:hypothetical protein|tara:strand:+ start:3360 stop:3575 length:216 start_codon:yes stop_codon:yes gene_type:complete